MSFTEKTPKLEPRGRLSAAYRAILISGLTAGVLSASFVFWTGSGFCQDKKKDRKKEAEAQGYDRQAYIDSAKEKKIIRLSLQETLLLALEKNSEILIARIDPKVKDDDVKIARAEFEPVLDIDFLLNDNTVKSSNALLGATVSTSREIDMNAAVSGKIITGAEYALEFLNTRSSSNSSFNVINPSYETEPMITVTQPLLRGGGIAINTADIVIARNDEKKSIENFKSSVMDVISDVKRAYYAYLYYSAQYKIAKASLFRAIELLKANTLRYKKGLVSSVDLLETEASLMMRQKELISSEFSMKRAEDELKYRTNIVDDPLSWNASLELTDIPRPSTGSADLIENLQLAFENRPDYEAKKIDLKTKDIEIKVAKNALFPTVDLEGSFGLNGLGGQYSKALESIDSDYKDWTVGVSLSLPWGGVERAEYNQSMLLKAQALLELKRLEQFIVLEVRDRIRAVDLSMRQIRAAKLALDKEDKNYKAQRERYASGQVSTHDILDYQEKLAQAESDYVKSLVDYVNAHIALDKSVGLTLDRNQIILEA